MDKNIIRQHLKTTFLSEATTPAEKLGSQIKGKNSTHNKEGINAIAKEMSKYEKSLTKPDANEKTMGQNKFNYTDDSEKEYHDEMEIMNGMEMNRYDREPDKIFKERALEAIEGSSKMGNNSEWANVVVKGQGGDPEFGKNLVKKIRASEKKRNQQTPTTKMFGDDWEVVKDEGHKPNAFESNKNKNKPQIKESMKRLKFKNEFNGVGNAIKMIPESYKIDKKVFEITDGNESYKVRWEGTLSEGKAIILMASDRKMVNEDIQKMKHLMSYSSEKTLGTVKGKDRLTENDVFNDIYNKTKKLMEMEDIDGQEAETEAEFDQTDISQASEAKKHIQGSVSTDKKTEAPKPKEGHWDKISVTQSPEAKKHIQGSTSTDKGTKAPKAKTGDVDDAVSQSPEAKKHIEDKKAKLDTKAKTNNWDSSKKKIAESELWEEEDEIDGLSNDLEAMKGRPEVAMGELDIEDNDSAYDADETSDNDTFFKGDVSLDSDDIEDKAQKISASDIKKAEKSEPVISKDFNDNDIDVTTSDVDVKLLYSKQTGRPNLIVKSNGRLVSAEEVPSQYLELAKKFPHVALEKIKAEKAEMAPAMDMDDNGLMESVKKDIENELKRLKR